MSKKDLIAMIDKSEDNEKSLKGAIQAYFSYISKKPQVVLYHGWDDKDAREINDMIERGWELFTDFQKDIIIRHANNIGNNRVKQFVLQKIHNDPLPL